MKVDCGKGITFDIDTDRLPANVYEHVLYIGLRNTIMDSHANATKDKCGEDWLSHARAFAEKKLAAMYAGQIKIQSVRQFRGDRIESEARRLCLAALQARWRAKGNAVSSRTTADWVAAVNQHFSKFVAQATANIEAMDAMDLDDDDDIFADDDEADDDDESDDDE